MYVACFGCESPRDCHIILTIICALGDVHAVLHQQVEDVPQDADAVLAVHFDTHEEARKVGRRRVFLSLGADSRQDYVTAREHFTAQDNDEPGYRNEYFTKKR